MKCSRRHFDRPIIHPGFSLIELVVVVVIIAIIGAIAIPRMSRGAAGAADSVLIENLAALRQALSIYQAEHGGSYPSFLNVNAALTAYSDDFGSTSLTRTSTHIYGPYLRTIPQLPVGYNKGSQSIGILPFPGIGWLYDPTKGNIYPATTVEMDGSGKTYVSY